MSLLARAGWGAWNFVVGDDWRLAVGVAAAIGLVAILVGLSVNAWWVLPAAVPGLLWWSVSGAARRRRS
ncbi:MAG TPA: hypothetical protein VMB91_00945 [Solirubrobacteraceae bacterium]|nr:hypothetical protein [Solirubrobacteraceae bacterium]